ncbi:MAG TPA: AAA family ATPase [Ktedonobacterales bacterium]|nr:AAA family ATPase [Ktedonobacterales bacterium]
MPQSPHDNSIQHGAASGASDSAEIVITDDLDLLFAALPPRIRLALEPHGTTADLLEIVLDLGRPAEARYVDRTVDLGSAPVSEDDLAYVTERIGAFGEDNRAGIGRTLHRISAIRNRRGQVVGLTCRVGRAVHGTVALIRDVVEQGRSILILGRPGVGKTTLLREAARVLADELGKRVVVVDTSNEIAGDGDVPHPGIGRARRMQVARPVAQHAVMIEAVENHMPEVVVIDEIGTELEAQAARTIAERGVQLVGTAHGRTLDTLLINPTLADLVGGGGAVTLGEEEARRRGTQKTVLERKAPPTFDVLIEQEERHLVGVHHDVAAAVDALLRGEAPQREMRERQPDGSIRRWSEHTPRAARADAVGLPTREQPVRREEHPGGRGGRRPSPLAGEQPRAPWWEQRRASADDAYDARVRTWLDADLARGAPPEDEDDPGPNSATAPGASAAPAAGEAGPSFRKRRVFAMGINRNHLDQAIHELGLPAVISRDEREADAVLVLKSLYRKQTDRVEGFEARGVPVFVLRSAGVDRIREALAELYRVDLQRQKAAQNGQSAPDDSLS